MHKTLTKCNRMQNLDKQKFVQDIGINTVPFQNRTVKH